VEITDSVGCNSTSGGFLITATEDIIGSGINIYPNPASQSIVIRWQSAVRGNVDITIVNVFGEKASPPTTLQSRGERTIVDVSYLPNGVYFLKINFREQTINKKFVVLH